MKYPDEHWVRVAKYYKQYEVSVDPNELIGGKTNHTVIIEKVQNHFPDVTINTVYKWVVKCRKEGYL